MLLGALAVIALTITAGLVSFGPGPTSTADRPSACGPFSATEGPVTVTCSPTTVAVPARWVLDARATPCELGIEVAGSTRSTQGDHVIVHGRTAGTATFTGPPCRTTIHPDDDPPAALPLQVEPTARSGATPLFAAVGPIVVTSTGDPTKCNATLFDDTGVKQGHRATPSNPLRLDVDGTYWVEAEVDGCRLTVTPG